MGNFKKEHPHFIISLKIADTKEIIQYVLQDNVEFGIIGAKLNHPSLHYEKFEEDEIIVVAPSDHHLTRKKRVNLEELLKRTLDHSGRGFWNSDRCRRGVKEKG